MSNETKVTKSYKISPELKEKLERLAAESGLDTQEGFIEHLAAIYDIQRLKEGNGAGYRKQIEELEYHLRRPLDLFIGMVETEAADRLQLTQQHEVTLNSRAETIFTIEQNEANYKKEVQQLTEDLNRLEKEKEAQAKLIIQLEVTAADKGMLVEQYKEKNDALTGLIQEYKAAADENKELQTKVSDLTQLTEKQTLNITSLEGDLAALDALKTELLRQQEERHKESVERVTERKEVEKERELLALRTEYQGKLEKANEEATAKLRDLYEQLRQQQPKIDETKKDK